MKRRDFIGGGLGAASLLPPALARAEYSGPLRDDYENWALLCLRIERSRDYYAGLYRQAVYAIANSGAPYERITYPSQSKLLGYLTEFDYGQPSPVFYSRVYLKGNDPMGYLIAGRLGGWVLRPPSLIGDMYGDRYDRNWPVAGHVGAIRQATANTNYDLPYSPGYLAVSNIQWSDGLHVEDHTAEKWSGGHQITIHEMLIVPGTSLKAFSDPIGFADLFRAMAKAPPPSVLPPAGILRREIK